MKPIYNTITIRTGSGHPFFCCKIVFLFDLIAETDDFKTYYRLIYKWFTGDASNASITNILKLHDESFDGLIVKIKAYCLQYGYIIE